VFFPKLKTLSFLPLAATAMAALAGPTMAADIQTPFGDPSVDRFAAGSLGGGVTVTIRLNPNMGGLCPGGAAIITVQCLSFDFLPDASGASGTINTNPATPTAGAFGQFSTTPPSLLSLKDVDHIQFPLGSIVSLPGVPPANGVPVPLTGAFADDFATLWSPGDGESFPGNDTFDAEFITSLLFENLAGGQGSTFALNLSGTYTSGTGETYDGTLAFSQVFSNQTTAAIVAAASSPTGFTSSFNVTGAIVNIPEPSMTIGFAVAGGLGMLLSKGNKKEES
jgi:hypothetical protein